MLNRLKDYKGTKAPGGKRAAKSKKNLGDSAEVFLTFREKTIKIKPLWNGRKSSSYLNGMPAVQFTGNRYR
jgi:hypothetical protein